MFRQWHPDKKFPNNMDSGRDLSTVKDAKSLQLLKDVYRQVAWRSSRHSIRLNVDSFITGPVKEENAMFGTD